MAFTFERATISQTAKLGLEATPGTSVAVTKRLLGLNFTPGPDAKFKTIKARGNKVLSGQVATSEASKIAVAADELSFTDIAYVLDSLIAATIPTVPVGGTLSHQRLYHIDPRAAQAVQTYSIENGDATNAELLTHAIFTDFTIPFSRDGVTGSGNMLADVMQFGVTPTTTGLSDVPLVIVPPKGVNVFIDDTWAALGTTKLTRAFTGEWALAAHQTPVWALDSSHPGFVNTVEGEAPLTVKLLVEANGDAAGLISAMRASTQKFIRISMTGPIIEDAIAHSLNIDLCGEVSAVAPMSDQGGVYAVQFTFAGVIDATSGNSCDLTLINALAAL